MAALSRPQRAHALRAFLFQKLGRVCALCGTTEDLQLDLIVSDGGRHHGLSHHDRQRQYLVEFNRNNLRVLCGTCNRSEGAKFKKLKNRRNFRGRVFLAQKSEPALGQLADAR